jgi:hypothetical protein
MSWKLVFGLSLFGAAMGIATVFVIPSRTEPFVWLGIFVLCGALIAKRAPERYFLHGVAVSFVNSVWITAAHEALLTKYLATHAEEAAMVARMAEMGSPRVIMAAMGPAVGLASGIVLGLFAFVFSKFLVSSHSEFAGW